MIKNTRKGFTTVELVIVIAVIAILATALIPTFGSLITSANTTADARTAENIYKQYLAEAESAELAERLGGTYYVLVNGKYFAVVEGSLDSKTVVTTVIPCYDVISADSASDADNEVDFTPGAAHSYDATTHTCVCGATDPA